MSTSASGQHDLGQVGVLQGLGSRSKGAPGLADQHPQLRANSIQRGVRGETPPGTLSSPIIWTTKIGPRIRPPPLKGYSCVMALFWRCGRIMYSQGTTLENSFFLPHYRTSTWPAAWRNWCGLGLWHMSPVSNSHSVFQHRVGSWFVGSRSFCCARRASRWLRMLS